MSLINNKELKDIASQVIYEELCYMYCDNCRFNSEIGEEESREIHGFWPCEDCHRKYNGWAVSKATSDRIAEIIVKGISEGDKPR